MIPKGQAAQAPFQGISSSFLIARLVYREFLAVSDMVVAKALTVGPFARTLCTWYAYLRFFLLGSQPSQRPEPLSPEEVNNEGL